MTDKTTDALAEARASVALDKGETETRCVDDFGVESVTHGGLEDPIATLRRYVRRAGSHGGVSAEQAQADDGARAAIDALATTLAEKEAELESYRRAFGPLIVGAKRVECLSCSNKIAKLAEKEARIRELEGQLVGMTGGWRR